MTLSKSPKSKISSVFITGTDTEVGKTVVTGLLAGYLFEKGYKVITQKWIQTGSVDFPADIDAHLKFMKLTKNYISDYLSHVSPYTFKFPSSPHLAAKLEKREINAAKIKKSYQVLSKQFDSVVAEGIGGALVPFNSKALVIDIAAELDLPVIIVAGNKLGAINHTLLTVEAVRARKMKILGIVFNSLSEDEDKVILEDNPGIVKSLTGEKILGCLPYSKDVDLLYNAFAPIGDRVLAELIRNLCNG